MKVQKNIKQWWWEGYDFHTIDANDKHTVYKNCYVAKIKGGDLEDVESEEIVCKQLGNWWLPKT